MNKTEYYANAADKAKEVMDGVNKGTYDHSLLSEWKDVFSYGKNHHNETLLGIDYNSKFWRLAGMGFTTFILSSIRKTLEWLGGFFGRAPLLENFPDGPRKDAVYSKQILLNNGVLVDWWATTDGKPYNGTNAVFADYRPMFVAFTVNKDPVTGLPASAAFDYTKPIWGGMCINKRHQLIRYSEVLLWYAESAARAGKDLSLAKSALKQVRARACSDESFVAAVDAMSAEQLAEAAYEEHGYEVAGYVLAMVTRRSDEFRMNRLKESYDYRSGSQDEVLVPAGTLTYSYDEETKTTFTYALQEDLKMEENMSVTVPWNGEASIYHNYPPKEVEKNPNLKR